MARFVVDIAPLRRYRHFRRLWAGQVISGLGSQLTLVAVSFQAYALTHSTLVVGLIGLAQLFPLLAGALWGGTLADAMDRKKVLVLTQVAMAAAVGGLVVNASLAHPAVWPLFVCSGAGAGFQGIDWPARRAALPMLVEEHDVTAAIALQTSIQQLALVAGPALAGVLIATIGLSAVYAIDVGSYGVALVAALLLPFTGAVGWRHADGAPLDGRGLPAPPGTEAALGHLLDRPQRHDLRHAQGRLPRPRDRPVRRRGRRGRVCCTPRREPAR